VGATTDLRETPFCWKCVTVDCRRDRSSAAATDEGASGRFACRRSAPSDRGRCCSERQRGNRAARAIASSERNPSQCVNRRLSHSNPDSEKRRSSPLLEPHPVSLSVGSATISGWTRGHRATRGPRHSDGQAHSLHQRVAGGPRGTTPPKPLCRRFGLVELCRHGPMRPLSREAGMESNSQMTGDHDGFGMGQPPICPSA